MLTTAGPTSFETFTNASCKLNASLGGSAEYTDTVIIITTIKIMSIIFLLTYYSSLIIVRADILTLQVRSVENP
jgi:hypothetical protein